MERRTVFALIALVIIIFVYIGAVFVVNGKGAKVAIQTDKTPVTLEIGQKKFMINSTHDSVRLPSNNYNYKATYGSGKDAISLYGTLDTTKGSGDIAQINLSYGVFSKTAITQALCAEETQSDIGPCIYKNAITDITYLSDHSWAIVNLNIPGPESDTSIVALQYTNGGWLKQAGPVTGVSDLSGAVPSNVLGGLDQ
jgi:hypothetical protein